MHWVFNIVHFNPSKLVPPSDKRPKSLMVTTRDSVALAAGDGSNIQKHGREPKPSRYDEWWYLSLANHLKKTDWYMGIPIVGKNHAESTRNSNHASSFSIIAL